MLPCAHPSPDPKRHPYLFSRLWTDDRRVSLYFTMGRPFSPQEKKLPLPMGISRPPSNTWFPGPTQVLNPKGSSIGTAVLAGLTSVTDRQTDQTDIPGYSVGNNRPHRSTMYIDATYCYRPSSMVCQSVLVCWSVSLSVTLVSPAKTAAPIEMPFGLRTWVGPRDHVLDGSSDPPWEGGNFWGRMGVPL